jgi:integrase
MTLSTCIKEMRHRRSLGVQFHGEQVHERLRRVVGDIALTAVDAEAVRRYIDGKGPVTAPGSLAFTPWPASIDSRSHVSTTRAPLPPRPPKPPAGSSSIYSETDVRLADGRRRAPRGGLARASTDGAHAAPAPLRHGLRISEALALTMADVDLREAILTIRETKFYKSRLVPIGADLLDVLERHRAQQTTRSRKPDAPFLSDRHGRAISRQTAELVFKRVREQAGLERPTCRTFRPRLHDFRHTFAMNRLVSWYRQGKNVQRGLPHLSTDLGHCSVKETQRYLCMTSELTMEAGLRFLKYAIPGGPHEDA